MSAKKLLTAALLASLLTACGGGAGTQALPGDGTYDDTVIPADDAGYGADGIGGDPGTSDPYGAGSGTGGTGAIGGGTGADGQIGDPTGEGFVLRGLVADQLGQPLAGAKVSIGAQTTLTSATGEFEITGIMDSQVWVDVTKDGFEAITRFNVAFTADKPTADKEFKLAAGGTGSSDGGSTDGGSTDGGPSLSHEGSFGGPSWKSVAAMAVDGNRVYVVGKIDKKFWFDRSAVVVFDAGSGEEISRIGDNLFSKVPKAASSIKVEDGEVIVSDGTNRATFDAAGEFVQSASGGGYDTRKTATDKERGITYTLKTGNKLAIDSKTFDGELRLEDVGNAKSIAVDDDGHILVLDDSQKTVHQFAFE